ncbi:MAG: hypothetical protein KGI98_15170, partial [Euryarchaeota archaeon]|nr:hypothetical protein [Euryarchaeota archaeon]
TGKVLLDLATDLYSPHDAVRKELGVELRMLGERLVGLDEEVLHPLSERLEQLGRPGRSVEESRQLAEEIRRLARDLLELSDRLGALASQAHQLGPSYRTFVQRGESLSHRLTDLGSRVSSVGDRLASMRSEELSFLNSMAMKRRPSGPAHPGAGSPGPSPVAPP